MSDRFLLDTHTWVWISLDPDRLKVRPRERLKREKEALNVSAVSLYEVAMLSRRSRIDLNIPMQSWFDLAFADATLRLLPVTPQIAVEAALLPVGFHGDPMDRIIAATARVHGLVLCTHDEKLVRFGQQGVYKFLEV